MGIFWKRRKTCRWLCEAYGGERYRENDYDRRPEWRGWGNLYHSIYSILWRGRFAECKGWFCQEHDCVRRRQVPLEYRDGYEDESHVQKRACRKCQYWRSAVDSPRQRRQGALYIWGRRIVYRHASCWNQPCRWHDENYPVWRKLDRDGEYDWLACWEETGRHDSDYSKVSAGSIQVSDWIYDNTGWASRTRRGDKGGEQGTDQWRPRVWNVCGRHTETGWSHKDNGRSADKVQAVLYNTRWHKTGGIWDCMVCDAGICEGQWGIHRQGTGCVLGGSAAHELQADRGHCSQVWGKYLGSRYRLRHHIARRQWGVSFQN